MLKQPDPESTDTFTDPLRPVILGEVLFDHFPDGNQILGGAPFNVAWNLAGFGANPFFVSAVGDDSSGKNILRRMQEWNMSTAGVEVSPQHPTGLVRVTSPESSPEYEILNNRAFDFLHLPPTSFPKDQFGLLYHGSLVFRSQQTRTMILDLRRQSQLPVFLDINMRPPWFDHSWLDDLLPQVTWLKLNVDELAAITHSQPDSLESIHENSLRLMHQYQIANTLVTDGEKGAHLLRIDGSHFFQPAPTVDNFVDSVGAGDAFASVFIYGILTQQPAEEALRQAVDFAARICGIQGATPSDKSFYRYD